MGDLTRLYSSGRRERSATRSGRWSDASLTFQEHTSNVLGPYPAPDQIPSLVSRHGSAQDDLLENTYSFELFRSAWQKATNDHSRRGLLRSLEDQRPSSATEPAEISQDWVGWLRCQWEIPQVLQEMQAPGKRFTAADIKACLGNFVAITGSKGNLTCSTCAEFLKQTWGNSGLLILDRLSEGAAKVLLAVPATSLIDTNIGATTSHIIISPSMDQSETPYRLLVDALVWICTAIRVNPDIHSVEAYNSMKASVSAQTLFIESAQQPGVACYSIQPLQECSEEDLGLKANCWSKFFTTGIVALRPIQRRWGAGLEMSFDMMIQLSAVENTCVVDGGTILYGFFTALVPISYDEASDSSQWHFESVEESSGAFLSPQNLSAIRKKWYKSMNIDPLRRTKCFVGWFEHANIMLGTRQLLEHEHHRLQRSSEPHEHLRSATREGFEVSGQIGFTTGPLNFAASFVNTWKFHSNIQRFSPPDQYIQAVRLAYTKVALIMDSKSKQAWLVPMISLILHLCHRYLQDLTADCPGNSPLPYAEPSPDGSSAARLVLEPNGHLIMAGREGKADTETLRQLFLRINTNLLCSAQTREPADSKRIFASELLDLIYQPGRGSPIKRVPMQDYDICWGGLTEAVDFVGVCANLGQTVQPIPAANIPVCDCCILPCGRYLLAAHILSLERLAQLKGGSISTRIAHKPCKLGEKAWWSPDQLFFTRCPIDAHQSIWSDAVSAEEILQKISSDTKRREAATASVAVAPIIPETGVVVFGGLGRPKRRGLPWSLRYP